MFMILGTQHVNDADVGGDVVGARHPLDIASTIVSWQSSLVLLLD
jgi:hypothetical protein